MVMAAHEDTLEYSDPSGLIEDALMRGAVGTALRLVRKMD
jgi:hypothetical protein